MLLSLANLPHEERNVIAPPREVKGSHMWSFKAANFDLARSVFLKGVDLQMVIIVELGVGSAKRFARERLWLLGERSSNAFD